RRSVHRVTWFRIGKVRLIVCRGAGMPTPIDGHDSQGQPKISRICVEPMMLLITMGLLVGLVVPNILLRPTRGAIAAVVCMVAGIACLAIAKASLWRQGIWTSWGSRRMTNGYAVLYKWAWAGIGTGIFLLLLTWRLTV